MGQAAAGGSCQCFCDIFAPSSSSFSSGGCWAAAESGARSRRMNHWDRNNRRRSGRRIEKKLRRWECGLALFRFFLYTKRSVSVCVSHRFKFRTLTHAGGANGKRSWQPPLPTRVCRRRREKFKSLFSLDAREEEKEKTTTSSGESMCGIPKRRVSLTFLAFFVLFKKEKKNEKFLFFLFCSKMAPN